MNFFPPNGFLRLKLALLILFVASASQLTQAGPQWTTEQAQAWYRTQPWPVGCNFNPHTAINQLEMWQADTFDPANIDKELGWAEGLGFNTVRVFLHNIPWQEDRRGLLRRMDEFLTIADKHHIKVMFVLLDAVWDPHPKSGKQRDPKPGVHNSGWVQSPGVEILSHPERHDELKPYVKGVLRHFKKDKRIFAWDLFNEPDNINRPAYVALEPTNKYDLSLQLLKKTFQWAQDVRPSQPLTAGVWLGHWGVTDKLSAMEKLMLEQSDIITFHNYDPIDGMEKCVQNLARFNRPVICSEYMARPRGSTIDPVMGYLHDHKVGAINWGFVNGKSQTIYPWDSWNKAYENEPKVWFHDIFRADGTPYDEHEVQYIRNLTQPTVSSK